MNIKSRFIEISFLLILSIIKAQYTPQRVNLTLIGINNVQNCKYDMQGWLFAIACDANSGQYNQSYFQNIPNNQSDIAPLSGDIYITDLESLPQRNTMATSQFIWIDKSIMNYYLVQKVKVTGQNFQQSQSQQTAILLQNQNYSPEIYYQVQIQQIKGLYQQQNTLQNIAKIQQPQQSKYLQIFTDTENPGVTLLDIYQDEIIRIKLLQQNQSQGIQQFIQMEFKTVLQGNQANYTGFLNNIFSQFYKLTNAMKFQSITRNMNTGDQFFGTSDPSNQLQQGQFGKEYKIVVIDQNMTNLNQWTIINMNFQIVEIGGQLTQFKNNYTIQQQNINLRYVRHQITWQFLIVLFQSSTINIYRLNDINLVRQINSAVNVQQQFGLEATEQGNELLIFFVQQTQGINSIFSTSLFFIYDNFTIPSRLLVPSQNQSQLYTTFEQQFVANISNQLLTNFNLILGNSYLSWIDIFSNSFNFIRVCSSNEYYNQTSGQCVQCQQNEVSVQIQDQKCYSCNIINNQSRTQLQTAIQFLCSKQNQINLYQSSIGLQPILALQAPVDPIINNTQNASIQAQNQTTNSTQDPGQPQWYDQILNMIKQAFNDQKSTIIALVIIFIICICLAVICIACYKKCCPKSTQSDQSLQMEDGRFSTIPLSISEQKRKIINELKQILRVEKYMPNNRNNQQIYDDNCSICVEQFIIYQPLSITPCQHAFHEKCLMNWIQSSVEKGLIYKNQIQQRGSAQNNEESYSPVCPNCNLSLTRQQENIAVNQLNNVLGLMSNSAIDDAENQYNSDQVNFNHVQIEMRDRTQYN